MDISVVIPTYQRTSDLLCAVGSLVAQEDAEAIEFEILVMDNASDDTLRSLLLQEFSLTRIPIRYLRVADLGLHNCRNLGAWAARGDIVAYIDDDVIVPKYWAKAMLSAFRDDAVAGVAGRVLPRWETDVPEWLECMGGEQLSLLDLGEELRPLKWPETPYGCNMAFRRSTIIRTRGFPPDGIGDGCMPWRRGDGETGFAETLLREGAILLYSPDAWLWHRIRQERTTAYYLRQRARKTAITLFYGKMRKHRFGRFKLLGLSGWNAAVGIAALALGLVCRGCRATRWKIDGIRHYATALYQLKLAYDPTLRAWVIREDYLPEDVRSHWLGDQSTS
jgi:glycosyltransferase involved in cell wall biosynthesis